MRKMILALTAGLALCLALLFAPAGLAAAKTPKPTNTPKPTVAPLREAWPELPPLDGEGYLAQDAGMTEFVHADADNGLWLYLTKDVRVEIQRYSDPNKPLIWYESILRCRDGAHLDAPVTNPQNPGTQLRQPEFIARKYKLVFAMSDDYFGDRKYNKLTQGIIVRDGTVVSEKTWKNDSTAFPNLETMALFPDGSLMVYKSKEHTGAEFVEMGATDVFAFGPILIRDGEVNETLGKKNNYLEPRCAFGMIEPNHYVSIIAEGRHSKSEGTGLDWIARRMKEMGVTQALNLDGGQTAALVFMGEKINTTGKFGPKASIRSLSGMISLGVSGLVPEND